MQAQMKGSARPATSAGEPNSLGNLLRIQAASRPEHPYLTIGGRSYTFAELDRRSDAVAAGLHALGVRPNDRVAILSLNRSEVVEIFFGAAKLGAIQVPINAFLKGSFLLYQLKQSEASVVIVDADGADALALVADELGDLQVCVLLDPPHDGFRLKDLTLVSYRQVATSEIEPPRVDIDPVDTMAIMFTSGTTGQPKGCMLNHGYYIRDGWALGNGLGLTEDDIIFTTLPLFHVAAQVAAVMAALVYGASAIIDVVFSARQFMARAAEVNATAAVAIGSMGNALLATEPASSDLVSQPLRCRSLGRNLRPK